MKLKKTDHFWAKHGSGSENKSSELNIVIGSIILEKFEGDSIKKNSNTYEVNRNYKNSYEETNI